MFSAPEIPHIVVALLPFGRIFRGRVSLTNNLFKLIKQCFSRKHTAARVKFHKTAVLIHRNTAVEQKIVVATLVHSALGKQKINVSFQLFTCHKGIFKLSHNPFFCLCQFIRIVMVNCGEEGVGNRILLFADSYGRIFKINLVKQSPVAHIKVWIAADKLTFKLKENNGNRLVHIGNKQRIV